MKFQTWMSMTVVCLFAALAMAVQANAQEIMSSTRRTRARAPTRALRPQVSISSPASNNGTHAFVGTPGQFTDFDAPGADPATGGTTPAGINDLGVVPGYYIDTNSVAHGVARTPPTAISTRSTIPERARARTRAHFPRASIFSQWSRDTTLTRTALPTGLCAHPTERSPRLTLQGPSAHFRRTSTTSGSSRGPTLTRTS